MNNQMINEKLENIINKYNKPIIVLFFKNVFNDEELCSNGLLIIKNLVNQQLLREKIDIICIEEDKKDDDYITYFCVNADLPNVKNICKRIENNSELKACFSLNVINKDLSLDEKDEHNISSINDVKEQSSLKELLMIF